MYNVLDFLLMYC